MKKYIQNIWVRLLACIMCMVSLLGIMVGVAGLFLFAQYPNREDALEKSNEILMRNYALYAIDNMHLLEEGLLNNTNVYITIDKYEYLTKTDEKPTLTDSYSNMPSGINSQLRIETVYENAVKSYNVESLLSALYSGRYTQVYAEQIDTTPIEGYVFDVNTGLFYYQTPIGFFKVDYIYVSHNGVFYDYRLTERAGGEFYYNSYYDITLDTTEYTQWEWVEISGRQMRISELYGSNQVQIITELAYFKDAVRTEDYYAEDYAINYVSDKIVSYNVSITLADNLTEQDLFYECEALIDQIYKLQDYIVAIQWGSIMLFVVGLVLLIASAPEEKERLRFIHKIPVIIFTGAAVTIEVMLGALIIFFLRMVTDNNDWVITIENLFVPIVYIVMLMLFVGFAYLANIITRIKTKTLYRYSELYYLSRPVSYLYHLAQENVSLFWKGLLVLLGISFAEFVLLLINKWEPDNLILCFFIIKVIQIPFVIYILFEMKRLQEGVKRVASGDLSEPIDTSKMHWELKKHGEAINQVSDGIAIAVEERMKSERFKTELITNVSHDIKTPLTSIINYVDLIKKEEITDPIMVEYMEVLDRQSARLKKLIEDLMEASKASTGNLDVALEECDMGVLLSQAVGEFEEKLMANELEVVVNKPETPVNVMIDGRHMWRIFDNLLNNVCKYSQANTRVYITLEQQEQTAIIIFKNISKTALNMPSDQLMQRFVRGDSSRHTEGSGLGLSIAQSLTELMGGTLKLDIDGDLFKVTLKFNTTA